MGDVVIDAHGEVVEPRLRPLQVIKHRLDHRRRELLGGEAVAPPQHPGQRRAAVHGAPALGDRRHHIEIERLAAGAGVLAAIQHGDRAGAGGQRLHQQPGREGPEQPHLEQPHPLAGGLQQLQGFGGGLAAGAHQHQNALGIRRPAVLKGGVAAAGEGGELIHRLLHQSRRGLHETVHRFAGLEIHIRVLGGAADRRPVGAEGPGPVGLDLRLRHQGA